MGTGFNIRRNNNGLFANIFGIFICTVFVITVSFVLGEYSKLTEKSTGEIIRVNEIKGSDSTTCSLLIKHEYNGKDYEGLTFSSSTGYCKKSVGEITPIMLEPENPQNLEVDGTINPKTILTTIKWALYAALTILTLNLLRKLFLAGGLAFLAIQSLRKK